MTDSILNPQGLKKAITNPRAVLAKWLALHTRAAYMEGAYVGVVFIQPEYMKGFIRQIEDTRRADQAAKFLKSKVIISGAGCLLPLAVHDELLDIASGVRK